MQNVLWIVALVVIGLTALAAIGGLGTLEDEDELGAGARKDGFIPRALFGYRTDVVDRLLDEEKK